MKHFDGDILLRGRPTAVKVLLSHGCGGYLSPHLLDCLIDAIFNGESDEPGREGIQQNECADDADHYFFQHSLLRMRSYIFAAAASGRWSRTLDRFTRSVV